MLKILLYNYIPFDDKKSRGGGVTVYLKNLIGEMVKRRDMEIFFLSSGCYCDIYDLRVRYEEVENIYGARCKCFSIINSPIFAPAYLSFYSLDKVINDTSGKSVFGNFLKEYGPFDVVHFHNLEGMPVNVLECKQSYPKTKFIFSLHNYYPFCPQVNLWKDEKYNCKLQDTGEQCLNCMDTHVPDNKLKHKMAMTYTLLKNPSERLEKAYAFCGKQLDMYYERFEKEQISQEDQKRLIQYLQCYRKTFVEMINANVDLVLAVSKRVCDIAVRMGINEHKIKVSYIGSKTADFALNRANCDCNAEALKLIYMGYQRRDKGYYFLVDVLNKMPLDVSKKLDIILAAKKIPNSKYGDVEIDKDKFHSFISKDGYKADEIPDLLSGKHLGIVPVLWEDNLPQVAIEMTAYGVPVLASDLGGTSELCEDSDFIFKSGDVDACIDRIAYFVNNPQKLKDYWVHYKGINTMKEHIDEMMGYWS